MNKEIHFYDRNPELIGVIHGYNETINCIISGEPNIHTTQMGLLKTSLFSMGYRVFVHEHGRELYEIKLGDNKCTGRYIRLGHNLFKMWVSGEFMQKGKVNV